MSTSKAVPQRTEFDLDEICRKAGGYFRATALIQKRLQEIIRYTMQTGENAVKPDNKTLMWRVLQEIEDGKIDITLAADHKIVEQR